MKALAAKRPALGGDCGNVRLAGLTAGGGGGRVHVGEGGLQHAVLVRAVALPERGLSGSTWGVLLVPQSLAVASNVGLSCCSSCLLSTLATDDGLDVGTRCLTAEVGPSDGVDEVECRPGRWLVRVRWEVGRFEATGASTIGDRVEPTKTPCPVQP